MSDDIAGVHQRRNSGPPLPPHNGCHGAMGLLAEAVYCTSWADQQTEFWLVLAVDGDFLVYVSADGRSLWRGDEDRPAESLEASPLQFAPMCLPSGSRKRT
jgi:hypothetical protein